MSRRITSKNYDSKIKDIIKNCIPSCKNIYFRVGYFYFSGFSLIADVIKNKNVKILIGMDTDNTISKLVNKSNQEIQNYYFNDFLEKADKEKILDSADEQDAYFIFEEKLKNGSLEIKQQINGDHSKEYLFEYDEKISSSTGINGRTITGSLNLSKAGLWKQGETVMDMNENDIFKEAKEDFLEIWNNSSSSTILVNQDNFSQFKDKTKKLSFKQTPSPYLMFVRVLNEYFKDRDEGNLRFPKQITDSRFNDYKYQKDAITKGYDIVKEHNGVLIADVVGLGKSIIASTIANNLNLPTFVITPPHLKKAWDDYLFEFKVNKKIFSTGELHKALDESEKHTGQKLIIIDEAHKFRNDETADYLKLYQICHGSGSGKPNKVLLLSATPFNNHPKDTFSLIKLFQIPTRSTLQAVSNLSEYFEQLTSKYNKLDREQRKPKRKKKEINKDFQTIGEQIRKIITPVMIRRSRIDLKKIKVYWDDLEKLGMGIPTVKDPILKEYDLKNLEKIYIDTLKTINPTSKENKYKCSRYKPLTYVKPSAMEDILIRGKYDDVDGKKTSLPKQQQNIADFMKRLLVRRFESCSYSFFKTLNKIIQSSEIIINYYEKLKVIPIYKKGEIPDYEELFDFDSSDDLDKKFSDLENLNFEDAKSLPKIQSLEKKGMWFINKDEIKEKYIEDVKRDLVVLNEIKDNWEFTQKSNYEDPKISSFIDIITSQIKKEPKRKIIIFSEFADTVEYVYKKMKDSKLRVFSYTSKDSSNQKIKEIISKNFDASEKKQENQFDVLIATDAISEGFNLHRAGTIFNFDIPYNPTRVVQRFGRINRINKKVFDELYIYNYFPSDPGEKEINMGRITALKKMMFNSIFGDDTKVLTEFEDLRSYFIEEFKKNYEETESPETHFENIIYNLRDYEKDTILEAESISKRVKCKRKSNKIKKGIVLFSKKGDIPRFESNQNEHLSDIDYLKIFEADKKEKFQPFERKHEKTYEEIKDKIFSSKSISLPNKKKKDLILKLQKLKETSKYSSYIDLLIKVITDLDALTPLQTKILRDVSYKNFDKNINDIENKIPKKLLNNLIDTYNEITNRKEALIITQQIND